MKKGILFLIFLIFIFPLVNAAQYECSDDSKTSIDSKEINEGEIETILGLRIGLCNYLENRIQKWVEGTVFIDADLVTLENSTSSQNVNLKQSNSSIRYQNVTNDGVVKLIFGGTTKDLELNDCSEMGNLHASITDINGRGTNATVKVLVGYNRRILNTKSNDSSLLKINSKDYLVSITGGSSDKAIIRVSSCRTGNLTLVSEITQSNNITSFNQTNSTTSNQTINNSNRTINQTNVTLQNCSKQGDRNGTNYCNSEKNYVSQLSLNQTCSQDYECISNKCIKTVCSKESSFQKLIAWIKGIFS